MKVAAHPMLVAVALGLLGPTALASDEERPRKVVQSAADCVDAPESELTQDTVLDAVADEDAPYWTRLAILDDDV